MASIERTAYPRFKRHPTAHELAAIYTPTADELQFAQAVARKAQPRLGLLLLLKSFQRLGYFPVVADIPAAIVQQLLERGGPQALQDDCTAINALRGDNYFPLLWRFYRSHRPTLFRLLQALTLTSTSEEQSLIQVLAILRQWRHFEVCVFSALAADLKSGDVAITGSEAYADYRDQLLPWSACAPLVAEYCQQLGFPDEAPAFVQHLRAKRTRPAASAFVIEGRQTMKNSASAVPYRLGGRCQ